MDNRDIVKVLESAISLMDLHEADPRKVKSYSNAIFNLERHDQKLREMSDEEILKLNGVGPSIAKAIREILDTGSMEVLDELHQNTPSGILELLNIRGIGAGKVKSAWKELNIESVDDMLAAIDSGELGKLKGFGDKTVNNLRASLNFFISNKNKCLLPVALEAAELIKQSFKDHLPDTKIEEVGELRLLRPVIQRLSFISSAGVEGKMKIEAQNLPFDVIEKNCGPFVLRGKYGEVPVEIYFCSEKDYTRRIFLETGSERHFAMLAEKGINILDLEDNFQEDGIYPENNAQPPVRREGLNEIQLPFENLIKNEDLKGILHCHSTYSDGRNTLREMAEGCRDMGYEYLGIADHSKSAFYYANGMYENRVLDQHKEIDSLNEELGPFKIFKGIESDILPDGQLDYSQEFLENFDFVVASVHSVLNMDIEKATQRLITAIENPYTTILGHLTGRVLLQRTGFPVNHKMIIDHCAKHDVVIEINAHPSRLDLDWKWVGYAMDKGVMLSVNPDAHALEGYKDMKYGVWMGQKGGLLKSMTLNALSANEISEFFQKRKMKISV